jgi:cytochrome c oxidase subunit II
VTSWCSTIRRSPAILVATTVSGCAGNQNIFNPAGPAARDISSLGWFLFAVCTVVYVVVMAALVWAIARRRHASDDLPEVEQRLTRTVSIAVGVTVITLIAFAVSSVVAGRGLTSPSGPGAITIDAIGHQWWWEFQYRDVSPSEFVTSPNELHIPVGVPVVIKAMSRDVIHSFWVPNLHGKRDLIPGQVTNFWIQADRPGVYRGQCAEFCGHQHANMAFAVVAEPMEKFQTWIQHQRRVAAEPSSEAQTRGREIFLESQCVMCHTVRGTTAGSRVGPELTHVGSRLTLAAGTLPNTSDHLARWVREPQAVKPGNRMPSTPMSAENREALLAYLRSLR